jgi:hypothetical protein
VEIKRNTMKNDDANSASTESASISDAEMAAVLANSSWERMERDANNVASNATVHGGAHQPSEG